MELLEQIQEATKTIQGQSGEEKAQRETLEQPSRVWRGYKRAGEELLTKAFDRTKGNDFNMEEVRFGWHEEVIHPHAGGEK